MPDVCRHHAAWCTLALIPVSQLSLTQVDDDMFATMVVKEMILAQQQHFTASEICVDTCADGQECIDHLTGDAPVGPYSVLLLDGQLGDMTGLEVLHALRSTEE